MSSALSEIVIDPVERDSSAQPGIDIRQALDILSSRASSIDHSHATDHDTDCHCYQHIPEEGKSMGQTIDLNAPCDGFKAADEYNGEALTESLEAKRKDLERAREMRHLEIRDRLQSMSVRDLLNAVMEAHRERVASYREYDSGLEKVLRTRDMADYPNICARATASFSVLSDTVNTIQSIVSEVHKRSDLQKLLIRLQQHERVKLNVTAALHLEQIRESNQGMQVDDDKRVMMLLQEGVVSMRFKVADCIESINDVLEEIRYAIADEEE